MKVNVVIAEDNRRLAKSLQEKLELNEQITVKWHVANGRLLMERLLEDHNIDIVLMDINMPEMDGIEATGLLKQKYPQIKVLMSTVFDEDDYIFKAIMAGANGYLLKDERPQKIHQSIEEVLEGGAPMSTSIAAKALSLIRHGASQVTEAVDYHLTKRETEILEQLAAGRNYQEIAGNLYISPSTVRKHIENIYQKLQVHNKVDAVKLALKNRLV